MSAYSGHRLRKAIEEKRPALGLYSKSGSPGLIEVMGYRGLDYVVADLEHSSVSLEMVEHMVKAAGLSGMSLLVRVPEGESGTVLRVLDGGANGVVFPHVNTKQDALSAVSLAKYAPTGKRGWGRTRRGSVEGKDPAIYCREANEDIIVTALIEEMEGVNNIDEILSVQGISAIDTGPGDLSQSLGVPGNTKAPSVINALERIYDACARRGMPVVISASFGESGIRKYLNRGARLLIELSGDETLFSSALRDQMTTVKGFLEQTH